MRIGFVGAGKVGFTLGRYMSERNVCVSGYYSRCKESARQASLFTHTKYYETLEEIIASSDALFLTGVLYQGPDKGFRRNMRL